MFDLIIYKGTVRVLINHIDLLELVDFANPEVLRSQH
jgi:hypothetical protein